MTTGVDAVGHALVAGGIVRHPTPTATWWAVESISAGGRVALVRNVHGRRALVNARDVVSLRDLREDAG